MYRKTQTGVHLHCGLCALDVKLILSVATMRSLARDMDSSVSSRMVDGTSFGTEARHLAWGGVSLGMEDGMSLNISLGTEEGISLGMQDGLSLDQRMASHSARRMAYHLACRME